MENFPGGTPENKNTSGREEPKYQNNIERGDNSQETDSFVLDVPDKELDDLLDKTVGSPDPRIVFSDIEPGETTKGVVEIDGAKYKFEYNEEGFQQLKRTS